MGIFDTAKRFLGQTIHKVGTALGDPLPEFGISEALAQEPSPFQTAPTTTTYPQSTQPLQTIAPISRPTGTTPTYQAPIQQQPQPQPSGDFMQFYPGWGEAEARANFQAEFGGDINRLAAARGFGGGDGGGGVPSAEEAARQSAEERMRRFAELVTPVQKDIESYLSSRRPITELFEEQMTTQGIPQKRENLALLEGQVGTLGEQLATIPTEDIARRKETGMLTAAAERRIRSMEERPIREQLLKTTTAAESERVGLQRAYSLIDKYLDVIREEEQRQLEPLSFRLQGVQAEFGQEAEALAIRLTGFTEDRKAKLKEYETQIAQQFKLTTAQNKEASDLRLEEAKHLNTLEEIAAKEKGEQPVFTDPDQIEAFKVDIRGGMNEADITTKWRNLVPLETLEWLLKEYARVIPSGAGDLGRPD